MAKLITDHDPFHVHKLLGLLVLLHFLYRFYLILFFGTAFPSWESPWTASLCVIAHGLLSVSSLLLPLPAVRNFSSPMIWPEFRFHSITFAMRHVISTLFTLNNTWPEDIVGNVLAKAGLVLLTIRIAAWVTDTYGDRKTRTTNSMPYPADVSAVQQQKIKNQYANSQFGATVSSMFEDATLNFAPLLAIQIAPFLMTLVRKGKINSFGYHRVYAFTLWMGYVAGAIRVTASAEAPLLLCGSMLSMFVKQLRIKFEFSSSIMWAFLAILTFAIYPMYLDQYVSTNEGSTEYINILSKSLWIHPIRQLYTYYPLFTYTT